MLKLNHFKSHKADNATKDTPTKGSSSNKRHPNIGLLQDDQKKHVRASLRAQKNVNNVW